MRTNPLSKAKELENRVARIVTAYLEGISSDRNGLTQLVPLYPTCTPSLDGRGVEANAALVTPEPSVA